MEERKNLLLQSITKLFMRNGIKSMTMDDIARGLAVSKKTLYRHFTDKQDVVYQSINYYLEEDKVIQEKILESGLNAIDELFEIMMYTSEKIRDIHPSIHYDLEKYYPEAWKLFNDYKFDFLYSKVVKNLEKGISEGLYRENMKTALIAKFHVSRIDMVFDPQMFPGGEINFGEVLEEIIKYHLFGITSEKGKKYLQNKFKNYKSL